MRSGIKPLSIGELLQQNSTSIPANPFGQHAREGWGEEAVYLHTNHFNYTREAEFSPSTRIPGEWQLQLEPDSGSSQYEHTMKPEAYIGRRTFLHQTMAGVAVCAIAEVARAAEAIAQPDVTAKRGKKFVVGHRGACAYAPENTLPSYRLAIEQRADYVEQDLQVTKDGVLVCSHDETLERMTNVAEVFPDRYAETMVKGKTARRWHFHDFTLKEIKQLDAGAKFNPKFKGTTIPTWQEAIDEIKGKAGLCPEIKNPEVYARIGMSMEKLFYDLLKKNGLEKPNGSAPILIQSFNKDSLKQLGQYGLKHPMLQLANARAKWTPEKLTEVKGYATTIGPSKDDVTEELVREAHTMGLQVVAYTYNAKNLAGKFPSVKAEIEHALYDLGVDGLFTDNPDMFVRRG